jgi:hypothetical protein
VWRSLENNNNNNNNMWWMLCVHAINWRVSQWLLGVCVAGETSMLQRVRWDSNCLGVYMYTVISALYAQAALWSDAEAGLLALKLHCWLTAFEAIVYTHMGSTPVTTLVHHAVVLSSLLPIWWSGQPLWCVWLCGLVEVTNVPLSLVYLLKQANRKAHPSYVACGCLLWVLYIPFRVLSLPVAFVASFYEVGLDALWVPVVWYGRVAILVLWVLSLLWFVQITRGLRLQIHG